MGTARHPKHNHASASQQAWRQAYGIDADPFAADDNPFYPGGQRLENLDSLRHLVHFSNRVLLVTGDKGSGKTFLLNRLCEYEKAALKLIRIQPELLQDKTSLLQQMAGLIELTPATQDADSELITRIRESCEKRFANGFRTLFIIDDAQDLSDDSLELLISVFGQDASAAIGILLLAEPQIIEQVRSLVAGSDNQPVHQIQLKNLTKAETMAYTEYYLVKFGWDKSIAFSPKLQARLHEEGRGIPGRINRIASAVLLAGNDRPQRFYVKPVYLFVVGVAAAVVVTLLIVVYQYADTDKNGKKNRMASGQGKQTIVLQLPDAAPAGTENELSVARSDISVSDPSANVDESDVQQLSEASANPELDRVDSPLPEDISEAKKRSGVDEKLAVDQELDLTLADTTGSDSSGPSGADHIQTDEVAGDDRGRTVVRESLADEFPEDEKSHNEASVVEAVRSEGTTLADKTVKTSEPKGSKGYFRTVDWLSAQPRDSWTIQILGSYHEESAVELVNTFQAEAGYFYVKSSYKSKDWYVVLHGVYSSKDQARDALKKLPEKQRAAGAWIRSLAGVQVR